MAKFGDRNCALSSLFDLRDLIKKIKLNLIKFNQKCLNLVGIVINSGQSQRADAKDQG
jgi:hypothetical protein